MSVNNIEKDGRPVDDMPQSADINVDHYPEFLAATIVETVCKALLPLTNSRLSNGPRCVQREGCNSKVIMHLYLRQKQRQ